MKQFFKNLFSTRTAKTPATWEGYRKFRVASKVREADNIFSFYLEPVDGGTLPRYLPGQYLTFRFHIPGQEKPVIRCYSLSDSPNHPDHYRITVKKILPPPDQPGAPPGLVSSFLVDSVKENDILEVKAPAGIFFLDMEKTTPVVLIAGGIGLTPVLSMLNTIAESGANRETWFFLGTRNGGDHPMKDHLERLAREHKNIHLHVCYSRPRPEDVLGRDYHHPGHVTVDLFKKVLPSNDFDYYLCGPDSMMRAIQNGLKEWGVPENRVHYEYFGPTPPPLEKTKTEPSAKLRKSFQVTFAKSGKTVKWDGSCDSLLEFAEANGINLDFGCRSGNCGTCSVKIISGEVDYPEPPSVEVEKGYCLTCSSVPKTDLELDA